MVDQFYKELNKNERFNKYRITATVDERNVVYLAGEVDRWQDVVDIGQIAGKLPGRKSIVNNITSRDYCKPKRDINREIILAKQKGIITEVDVVIIGGGVTGAGIARTLSRYDRQIVLVEKCSDISEGTSKANNGMIHPGHDPKFGTLKAKCNVKGNEMYTRWASELNFHLTRPGMLLVAFNDEDTIKVEQLYENALKNGVPYARLVSKEEALVLEPQLDAKIVEALWLPTAGFVEPYAVVEALMENAIDNGTRLMLDTEVVGFEIENQMIRGIITNRGIIKAKCVINAAGLYADDIAEMADDRFYTIHPRRGVLLIFDQKAGKISTNANLSTLPSAYSKGGGNMKTPSGNPLWGPSAKEIPEKDDLSVDEDEFETVMDKILTKGISAKDLIAFFSGIRASDYTEDFIIEASKKIVGFIHVAGIQSPGLASAPAIAEMVEDIYLGSYPDTQQRKDYNPIRKKPITFRELSREEQDAVIKRTPKYGHITCRCETVSEGEIINAIHGTIPATTVDAVKRRTRAGMGRCQGGFCGSRVIEILARELCIPPEEVTKRGRGTEILVAGNRAGALEADHGLLGGASKSEVSGHEVADVVVSE
jgi:glycerol-3-phosphate dehydrogenase